MAEIYWLTRVGTINTFATVAFAVSVATTIGLFIGYLISKAEDEEDLCAVLIKWSRRLLSVVFVSAAVMTFVPSQKELLAIYGIGGTIDYIKSSDKAKQLPDKVVNVLNKYIETLDEDEN